MVRMAERLVQFHWLREFTKRRRQQTNTELLHVEHIGGRHELHSESDSNEFTIHIDIQRRKKTILFI